MNKNCIKDYCRLFWILLYVFVCFALFCVALSYTTYDIYGDSVVYFEELVQLRGTYFSNNFGALLSSGSEHVQLATEGGFAFFLFLFSLVNTNSVFYVSSIFTVSFLMLLALLSVYLAKNRYINLLVGLMTLLGVVLLFRFSYSVFALSALLRDSSAHFFGFLGMFLCCIGIKKGGRKRFLLSGGISIGLACWCRVPDIIFVIPVGVYALCSIRSLGWKSFLNSSILLVIGLLLGLLPLFGQNVFEGKPFYMTGQMDLLLLKDNSPNVAQNSVEQSNVNINNSDKQHGVKKGLAVSNCQITARRLFTALDYECSGVFFVIILFSLLICLFFDFRFTSTFASGALCFFLFYMFYDKTVARYYIIITIFLLPIVALCFMEVLCRILKLLRLEKSSKTIYVFFAGLAVISFILFANKANHGYGRLLASRMRFLGYSNALEGILAKGDYYTTSLNYLGLWTAYITGAHQVTWVWSASEHPDNKFNAQSQISRLNTYLEKGNRIIFIYEDREAPWKAWTKQDIRLNYDLKELASSNLIGQDTINIAEISKIKRNSYTRRVKKHEGSQTKLFVWTADMNSVFPPSQGVIFETINGCMTNTLVSGFNIYDIPDDFFDNTDVLKCSSTSNLPVIVEAEVFSTNLVIALCEYGNMPAVVQTFDNINPFWLNGSPKWLSNKRTSKGFINPVMKVYGKISWNSYLDTKDSLCVDINVFTRGSECVDFLVDELRQTTFTANGSKDVVEVNIDRFSRKRGITYLTASISCLESEMYSALNVFEYDLGTDFIAPVFINSVWFSFKAVDTN